VTDIIHVNRVENTILAKLLRDGAGPVVQQRYKLDMFTFEPVGVAAASSSSSKCPAVMTC
jgi:hypothetical protein